MRAWLCVALCAVLSMQASQAAPPALMHAQRHHDGIDPAAYWVSEKLDGVRAVWDGRVLRFRSGRPIAAPAWFTASLPAVPLDGELWIARGRFDVLSGVVRRDVPDDVDWQPVRYLLFDLPGAPGDFSQRLARLKHIVADAGLPWLQAVPQQRVADRAELASRFAEVVAGGGEGLMLHRADALWTAGRSDALLKLTPFFDAEAAVTGHVPGKGRHRGRLGALEVVDAEGRRFRIGSGFSDASRIAPPAIGTQVTYRYRELTARGLPRFPVFVRVRDLP
ncbi:DNA ligase [Methyloversatilis sp. RAC08]|uniref:DNA ligase n=1 Tax=Methyloversatilis sp. RAC08 TaxID=1842540 RepID=UPI00083DD98F|nr:DNA ligase [Methyloversatilis sp. RAC08]